MRVETESPAALARGRAEKKVVSSKESIPTLEYQDDWRDERRTCQCRTAFKPKREAQRHCSTDVGLRKLRLAIEAIPKTLPGLSAYLKAIPRPSSANVAPLNGLIGLSARYASCGGCFLGRVSRVTCSASR